MKKLTVLLAAILAMVLTLAATAVWQTSRRANQAESLGLQEVSNGDAQFWLMQGPPNNRHIPCTVHYFFDRPLDETLVRERLQALVSAYPMFRRNIVELDGLPYWQTVDPDWQRNVRRLSATEQIESVRIAAEADLSRAEPPGAGIPMFRAYLSADGRQLTFMWHHLVSDFEGMFNKHARHLFHRETERTRFGYQMGQPGQAPETGSVPRPFSLAGAFMPRPLGFEGTAFDVSTLVLPVEDRTLNELGQAAGLPMSDIFSFITMRAVTRYHESISDQAPPDIRPVVSPLSLRRSSLETDEGNNRAIKYFPLKFPLEPVAATYRRITALAPASSSYEQAGRMMKRIRALSIPEAPFRRMASPDYISNYFPLADEPLQMGEATLVRHALRVPMVPHERTKFAWSNYAGEVQLYLHTDPMLVEAGIMRQSFELAAAEVLEFLEARK
jgi:hypothetical protein